MTEAAPGVPTYTQVRVRHFVQNIYICFLNKFDSPFSIVSVQTNNALENIILSNQFHRRERNEDENTVRVPLHYIYRDEFSTCSAKSSNAPNSLIRETTKTFATPSIVKNIGQYLAHANKNAARKLILEGGKSFQARVSFSIIWNQ